MSYVFLRKSCIINTKVTIRIPFILENNCLKSLGIVETIGNTFPRLITRKVYNYLVMFVIQKRMH